MKPATGENPDERAAELARVLDVLARKAPSLRAAGVRQVVVDGIHIELVPADTVAPKSDEVPPPRVKDLDDPVTYGRTDGTVPGLRRTWEDD